jgi:RNA polymerase sigma-70 factor (ECF subfamily)
VELCLRGDEDAWEAIIKLYGKRIFNHALRLIASRDEAEDITQEIFIRAFINLRGFRSETGSFRNWLFRVGRNLIIDNYRKKKRLRATMAPDELESLRLEDFRTPNPQHLIELEEAAIFLRKGLMTLSPEIKKALELRDVEGLSYFEIAQVAGVSQGTVKSRISRGRVQLGKFIIKERAHVGSRVSPSS